jgi:hypothetical protein
MPAERTSGMLCDLPRHPINPPCWLGLSLSPRTLVGSPLSLSPFALLIWALA